MNLSVVRKDGGTMKTEKNGNNRSLLAAALLVLFSCQVVSAGEDVQDGSEQNRSAVIYSVSVEPAKVASGETILIEAVFSLFDDSPQGTLPMEYFCEIESRGRLIYQSPIRVMDVVNGAKSHLEVKLQATGGQGDYKVALEMVRPGGNIREEGSFSIVSPMEARMYRAELLKKNPSVKSAVENRLVGRWKFVMPDPESPAPELVISKEEGELTARISRGDAGTLWVKLRKTENSLVVRSKSANPGGDCWYIVEDVITFNDHMDDMPVQSKVLEGGRCVSVGRVSEGTLCRVE